MFYCFLQNMGYSDRTRQFQKVWKFISNRGNIKEAWNLAVIYICSGPILWNRSEIVSNKNGKNINKRAQPRFYGLVRPFRTWPIGRFFRIWNAQSPFRQRPLRPKLLGPLAVLPAGRSARIFVQLRIYLYLSNVTNANSVKIISFTVFFFISFKNKYRADT